MSILDATIQAELAKLAYGLQTQLAEKSSEADALRAMLIKARAGLSCGLWDYGPGQDEHEQCNELLAEIDVVLGPNVGTNGPGRAQRPDDGTS
jgi:hypothetical protein